MLFFYLNPILIAAAIIPAIFLLIQVYRADRLEREPPALLLSLILYGILATGFAMVTERAGSALLSRIFDTDSLMYKAILYFVVVAFSEEGFKYLLLKKRTWYSPAFNCQFDGVVYAVFVSLGFALWENIGYVIQYGLKTAMLRAVTAVPGHAKRYDGMGKNGVSRFCRIMAFLIPSFMHGCYDFIATMESLHFSWIFAAFIAVMFVIAFLLVRNMSKHDRYIARHDTYLGL